MTNTNPTIYLPTTLANDDTGGNFTITGVTPNYDLDVRGSANIEGDLKVKGVSLLDTLELITQKLGILIPTPLQPDKILLEKYEELQELKHQYEEMEAQFKLMQTLKD